MISLLCGTWYLPNRVGSRHAHFKAPTKDGLQETAGRVARAKFSTRRSEYFCLCTSSLTFQAFLVLVFGVFWLCILNFCWQYSDITKKCQGHINTLEKKDKLIFLMSILKKNEGAPEFWCPGTRTLMPFQVDNWFFIVISRMDIRNINLSFSPSVFMCSWHFLVKSEYCQQKLRIHNQEYTKKIVGAPEFWCPGTRTLVPFQVDNRFFVLISKMGFRNINLSFFPSVFMCSRHFLF